MRRRPPRRRPRPRRGARSKAAIIVRGGVPSKAARNHALHQHPNQTERAAGRLRGENTKEKRAPRVRRRPTRLSLGARGESTRSTGPHGKVWVWPAAARSAFLTLPVPPSPSQVPAACVCVHAQRGRRPMHDVHAATTMRRAQAQAQAQARLHERTPPY